MNVHRPGELQSEGLTTFSTPLWAVVIMINLKRWRTSLLRKVLNFQSQFTDKWQKISPCDMLIRTSQSQQWVRWSKDDEWSEIKESFTRESVYFQHARKTLGSEEKKCNLTEFIRTSNLQGICRKDGCILKK